MNWFAIYTKSRFEKEVYSLLREQAIEAYLPLQKTLHQWSDRKKWVESPLISSYVFVCISEKDHFRVLNTSGVICYVTFSGKAGPIQDVEIRILQRIVATETDLEVFRESILPGEEVNIIAGNLMGLHGELIEYKGNKRIVMRIGDTGHTLLLTVPSHYLQRSSLFLAS